MPQLRPAGRGTLQVVHCPDKSDSVRRARRTLGNPRNQSGRTSDKDLRPMAAIVIVRTRGPILVRSHICKPLLHFRAAKRFRVTISKPFDKSIHSGFIVTVAKFMLAGIGQRIACRSFGAFYSDDKTQKRWCSSMTTRKS